MCVYTHTHGVQAKFISLHKRKHNISLKNISKKNLFDIDSITGDNRLLKVAALSFYSSLKMALEPGACLPGKVFEHLLDLDN